ncbi:MAG: hypothetical protein R3353_01580 [Salegentibacter mishustinae]|nr:hypothetical protein [Salegentibacter mishustinae]
MINHNKAYLLGLITGGGRLDKETFIIELPFKKWGMDPKKMGKIAVDILERISKLFQSEYQINVTYEIANSKWLIKPIQKGNFDRIKADLENLGLPTVGFLLNKADLVIAKSQLSGINAETFLSGIFDTRASITKSHRRFNSEAPVVSIEIPGSTKNFKLVVQLCSWLTEMGSTTDQILYNHPNQHAASDPYYKGWKKGFKIRFLVRSFLAKHSFALEAKSFDVKTLEKVQKKEEQDECPFRKIKQPSPISVHEDMNSSSLPEKLKDKLFFHYFHYCASLGCKFAPKKEVKRIINEKSKLISFFPRLSKGNFEELNKAYLQIQQEYFSSKNISQTTLTTKRILNSNEYESYYGLKSGLAFLLSPELNGKRHKGPMEKVLKTNYSKSLVLSFFEGTMFEPILMFNEENDRAIICSNILSKTNQKLIKEHTKTNEFDVNLV